MVMKRFIIFIFFLLTSGTLSTSEFLTLEPPQTIIVDVFTSQKSYAGTDDNIAITLFGEFAVSGPHDLGSFGQGTVEQRSIVPDRPIGTLKKVSLYNGGTDGWLLSTMQCRIGSIVYELAGPRQWLDTADPQQVKEYDNGFEPLAQDSLRDLPAGSVLELKVVNTVQLQNSIGL